MSTFRPTVLLPVVLTTILCVNAAAQDWQGLHNSLISFYRYQRAGLKTSTSNASGNPYNPFYTHTASDGKYPHSNDIYDGGWYDAGDFVKFGLPAGFTTYALLLGYDVFPTVYDDRNSWSAVGTPNGIPDILDEAKVGTDYLIKCIVSSTQIVLDIGDGVQDHMSIYGESGYENSNRLNNRQVKIWCSGADAPALYAASLALMSRLYAPHDATYAALCLQKAKDAFTFCIAHQSVSTPQRDQSSQAFYSTAAWKDKMSLAAAELYRATNDQTYLTWAKDLLGQVGQHYDAVGYANTGDFAAYRLTQLGIAGMTTNWSADISTAIGRVVGGSSLVAGASVNTTNWAVCRTAAAVGFSSALYYMVTGLPQYRDFALQQLKWIAGISPYTRSYITQWGTSFPNNPHHRNDLNITSVRLVGGLVSGPTAFVCTGDIALCNWQFSDARESASNTEPALDYNACATGLAGFARFCAAPSTVTRLEKSLTATPDNVDFNTKPQVAIAATIEKSVAWKIVLRGATSGAMKQYSGTSASPSVNWSGDADSGAFTAGEQVHVVLDVPSLWPVQQAMARATIFLANTKTEAFRVDDIPIDDFNDAKVLENLISGFWSGFSDSAQGGTSSSPAISADPGGKDATSGILFRLTRRVGAAQPVCGIRTTFKASGASTNIGPVTSIVFDIFPTADYTSVWLELEQPSMVDRAYYAKKIDLGLKSTWYRIRVPITSLTQPSWKASAVPLSLGAVTALRISGYGEANDRFILDNVRMQGMRIDNAATRHELTRQQPAACTHFTVNNNRVAVQLSHQQAASIDAIEIISPNGRCSARFRDLSRGDRMTLSSDLGAGCYMLRFRDAQGRLVQNMRFVVGQ